MPLDLYAIGNALVDSEYLVQDDFLAGQSIEKGCMTLIDGDRQSVLLAALNRHTACAKRASGGSAANSVIAFSAFGGQAFYACKVADDDNGAFYLDDLRAAGVRAPAHARVTGGVTGTCVVMVTPDAERTMNTHLGITAEMSASELDLAALEDASFLYIEGYLATSPSARHAVATAREIAARRGIPTALTFSDPAMVQYARGGLTEMLADGVDILFCNESEAMLWSGAVTLDEAIRDLHRISPLVVITRGAQGAVVSREHQQTAIAPFPVKAVDSNGAGDAFAGAFLFGLSRGWSLADCGRLASRTAAQVVSRFGPRLDQAGYAQVLRDHRS
ncbi:MAG TPA: adenosine kinase [Fluviicoccus sp.]|nr:adenosine kinase [Fluviicoccus sp.]